MKPNQPEPKTRLIAIRICEPCLAGEGEECHTPGCALFLHRVDLVFAPELYETLPDDFTVAALNRADADARLREGRITFYELKFYMFSNFSSFQVDYKGRRWPTSEHAYQAMKFENFELQEQIRRQTSAHEAMKLARLWELQYRPDWEQVKVPIMLEICRAKLHQHPYIQRKLKESGTRELIESSPVDSFWGWGPNKDGQNHLGKVWMTLRKEMIDAALFHEANKGGDETCAPKQAQQSLASTSPDAFAPSVSASNAADTGPTPAPAATKEPKLHDRKPCPVCEHESHLAPFGWYCHNPECPTNTGKPAPEPAQGATPRVDAAESYDWPERECKMVSGYFARLLERELQSATARAEEAEKAREEAVYDDIDNRMGFAKLLGEKECFTPVIEAAIVRLRTQLADAQRERNDALEQAKQARASRHAQEDLAKKGFEKWKEQETALRADLRDLQSHYDTIERARADKLEEAGRVIARVAELESWRDSVLRACNLEPTRGKESVVPAFIRTGLTDRSRLEAERDALAARLKEWFDAWSEYRQTEPETPLRGQAFSKMEEVYQTTRLVEAREVKP